MKIIDRINEWWDRLDSQEQSDLKKVSIISLIAVPVIVIATGLLLPYVYPALAALSFTIAALCALAYLVAVFIQIVAPIILKHYNSEPTVISVTSITPANNFVSEARLTKEPITKDRSQLPQNDNTAECSYK